MDVVYSHPFTHPSRTWVDPIEVLPCMMKGSFLQPPVTLCVLSPLLDPSVSLKSSILFMCVSVHMFGVMCTMYLQVPTEAWWGFRFSGAGVAGGYEQSDVAAGN